MGKGKEKRENYLKKGIKRPKNSAFWVKNLINFGSTTLTKITFMAGENRVGFFTKRDVEAGEELNFDYKYERYGQVGNN